MHKPLNKIIQFEKPALLYIENKKLLMARNEDRDLFYFLGGKREPGETDFECLKRELYEELQVALIEDSLEKYFELEAPAHGKPEGTIVKYIFYFGTFEGEPTPSNEIAELKYFIYKDHPLTNVSGKLLLKRLQSDKLID